MGLGPTCYTSPARLGAVKVVQYDGSDEDGERGPGNGGTANALLVQHRPVAAVGKSAGQYDYGHTRLMDGMVTRCDFLWKGGPSEECRR